VSDVGPYVDPKYKQMETNWRGGGDHRFQSLGSGSIYCKVLFLKQERRQRATGKRKERSARKFDDFSTENLKKIISWSRKTV